MQRRHGGSTCDCQTTPKFPTPGRVDDWRGNSWPTTSFHSALPLAQRGLTRPDATVSRPPAPSLVTNFYALPPLPAAGASLPGNQILPCLPARSVAPPTPNGVVERVPVPPSSPIVDSGNQN